MTLNGPLVLMYYFGFAFTAYVIYAIYWALAAKRRTRRNLQAAMAQTDELAARSHADAERIIALLTDIRDRLDQRE